jgi:hypothetical protein
MRRIIRLVFRALRLLALCAFIILLIPSSTIPLGDPWRRIGFIVGARHFDYVGWEVSALAAKAEAALWGVHPFMTEADRTALVRAYFADLDRAIRLDSQIAGVYAESDAPDTESSALRAERDALRASLTDRQTLVESILEGQVSAALVEQGFGVGGQILPPVLMRFTETPQFLVVSPRDRIGFEIGFSLHPISVDEAAQLEARVEATDEYAALVVPIGGMALYPAMVLERPSIPTVADTFAHEWLHHYLFFFPLGLNYDFDNETRIINETTATLFGQEMARLILDRYYPDLALDRPPDRAKQGDPFDFGAALDETRRTVDDLLAEGRIDEAEAYMEERRGLFVANGYLIRRLNQAFFAFYGGYQTGAPGAGGGDPIGAAVRAIRDASPSIRTWIETMRGITTRAQLLDAAESVGFRPDSADG